MRISWPCAPEVRPLFAVLLLLPMLGGLASAFPMEVLVPAYFYPTLGPDWGLMTQAAASIPITAILNPASGPGDFIDPNYVAALGAFRAAGGRVLGYVTSSYATRDLAVVEDEVERYVSFYSIDGIFVDEMTNDTLAVHTAFYADLYDFIKSHHPSFRVIGNPGVNTQESYLSTPTADALLTFEFYDSYRSYVPDGWTRDYPPDCFAHVPYRIASADTMLTFVQLAASRNAGMVFVTDADLPNPYDRLPTYWNAEVACVAALRTAGAENDSDVRVVGSDPEVRLAPNPARDRLEIRLQHTNAKGASVWIADPSGRVIADLGRFDRDSDIPWPRAGESLPAPGVYFVVASTNGPRTSQKLLLVR